MKNKLKLMYQTDFYKVGHKMMYPTGTTNIYSVWTARNTKFAQTQEGKVVHFGLGYFLKELSEFSKAFFEMTEDELTIALNDYKEFLDPRHAIHWLTECKRYDGCCHSTLKKT